MSEDQEIFFVTNVGFYRQIARENYEKSKKYLEINSRPKKFGGRIIKYDPVHNSFKHALISIVFVSLWLEAALNINIAQRDGVDALEKNKMKTVIEKLKYLDCDDIELISRVKKFMKEVRHPLVLEKAPLDQK